MKIAYLSCSVMLPDSPDRRSDGYEHDLMIAALAPPLREYGLVVEVVDWADAAIDWHQYQAAIIGTTWDYWDHKDEFLATLRQIERAITLYNPAGLVQWNSHKSYLKQLADQGARLIPTLWLDDASQTRAAAAFDQLGSDDLVFKRQVGAGASGQYRLQRGDPIPPMPHAMMVQPFVPQILAEGEFSFIFIEGEFCHALLKKAQPGDYRIQSTYGGYEVEISPSADDLADAQAIMATLAAQPLYARVDMIRENDGRLLLMELELIEPYLYPQQGPELGDRLARAIATRLDLRKSASFDAK
ncbi:MAG: hypothetical protein CME93_04810 [Hyphomonadaceae bacterium]|nr:hypothetical protein [Hyphomonadaceae bacterium]OUX94692.1 MAG: hypothetical protein CBB77_06385 [Hyphomonas sp. TMED17]